MMDCLSPAPTFLLFPPMCNAGYAVAQWLGLCLQLLGVAMVAGVSFMAVLEHHFSTVDPGTSPAHTPSHMTCHMTECLTVTTCIIITCIVNAL